jgi:acyl-coenzyme A thioesterase PaaI-like protein
VSGSGIDGVPGASGSPGEPDSERRHVLQELGFSVNRVGDELHGSSSIVPEMFVPGTNHLRTSILAAWADTLTGLLAVDAFAPRVPVTLELDVHLFRPAPGGGTIRGVGRVVKSGRSVFVGAVDFEVDHVGPIGFAAASFMVTPDRTLTITRQTSVDRVLQPSPRMTLPFADRAGCERRAPGQAVFPRSEEALNASNTVNGGLIALGVEEAALSLTPGATLSSLALRYLQPVRFGPVVAEAEVRDGLARIEVRDAGNESRLCVVASSRIFDE